METTYNKLPLNQNLDEFIIVESKWLDDEVKINILEYRNSKSVPSFEWQGKLLNSEIMKTCEALEGSYDAFYAECKNALCQPNGLPNFIYTIDSDKFTWKKVTGGTKIIYGRVALTKSTESLHLQFLLNSLDLCSQLHLKLVAKESEIEELKLKHKQFLDKYDNYVTDKDQHDKDLLKKFLLLLNNKKAKISELNELLCEKSNTKEDDDPLLSLSDNEQEKTDDERVVADLTQVPAIDVRTQINDESANESSQSQELQSLKIPKRKQPAARDIEAAIKVRVQETVVPDNNELEVNSQVYNVDTQDMLDDM